MKSIIYSEFSRENRPSKCTLNTFHKLLFITANFSFIENQADNALLQF